MVTSIAFLLRFLGLKLMPKEITIDEIDAILPRTIKATIKRSGEFVKFKLRTKKTLFTIKTSLEEADAVEKIITSGGKAISISELD